MRIVHQTQPTLNSCVATCIAMLGGISATDAHEMFTRDYLERRIGIPLMLARVGLQCESLLNDRVCCCNVGEVYLAVVPSPAATGLNHMVVLDCFTNDGEMRVLDPAMGTGKPYYVHKVDMEDPDVDPLAVPLVSYTLTHRICVEDTFHGSTEDD